MKAEIQTSIFSPESVQGPGEYHSVIRIPQPGYAFQEQLDAVVDALDSLAARPGKEIRFVRFFLSDAANQKQAVADAMDGRGFPVSYIQQPPLDGTKLAAWVYSCDAHSSRYEHFMMADMTAEGADSETQMAGIFARYEEELSRQGMSVAENCVRTWIFVHDVDVNYGGVVKGRRDYFDRIGLTSDTHYIASTGIEGRNADPKVLVTMDAIAVRGLGEGQIQHLYALDHLSRTSDYGVTFERGTAIHYADRTHAYISGTASIDSRGEVMYVGDVCRQTERMLENIEALLAETHAGLDKLAVAIVYLRDIADYGSVRRVVSSRCPGLNAVYVLAPVCRPAWLVEMECIAVF